ncbi:MAG: histidinol dehydrogenase [Actinobacteria bacterium]|nr:histidinol dehydrogenase [Actinomycetota bacterium]
MPDANMVARSRGFGRGMSGMGCDTSSTAANLEAPHRGVAYAVDGSQRTSVQVTMLQYLDLIAEPQKRSELFVHEPAADADALATVRTIIGRVKSEGDRALKLLTKQFDAVDVSSLTELDPIEVPRAEREDALLSIGSDLREALEFSEAQIREYHRSQLIEVGVFEREGVVVQEIVRAVERAGIYVPGGRAVYPSTVLMTTIPAQVAGVEETVLCVPPGRDGKVPVQTLAAAAIAGVDRVFRVGGAQAIAAMAYGTESIPAVDVIVGPGNRYVALAKREVNGVVGIDSMAGPSELVVVADKDAPPAFVAADLLAQAEHGPDGKAVVISDSADLLAQVQKHIAGQLATAERSADIAETLSKGGFAVLVGDLFTAMDVVNDVAPEHLELVVEEPGDLLADVRNAGAVFLGPYAPAALGDYCAGPNHVLPTGMAARYASALQVSTFQKQIHVVSAPADTLRRIGPYAQVIANEEGLAAHANSIRIRNVAEASI